MALLELTDVEARYGAVRALHGVSLAVDEGELVSVLDGPCARVGHAVLDPEGRKIGVAKEVFANGRGEPEYVRVGMGAFGLKRVLIPVQLVALDEKRRTMTLR